MPEAKPYYTPNIFKPAPRKVQFATQLRRNMTPAESLLWRYLKNIQRAPRCRNISQWRPQVVIRGWIVDFYNDEKLLAVEIDGPTHDAEKDQIRDAALRRYGIRTLRYRNQEIYDRLPEILQDLERLCLF